MALSSNRRRVVVVGAGISGIACARELADAGLPVQVCDRSDRIGGRMAVRTIEGRAVDVGASYFTVRAAEFSIVAEGWLARGLARPWTDTFHIVGPDGPQATTTGPMRYAAPAGLRSLVEDLAAGLDPVHPVDVARVTAGDGAPVVGGEQTLATVLAMPTPLAYDVLDEGLRAELPPERGGWDPTITVVATFDRRSWRTFDGAFVTDSPVLSFVADDGRRRGDDAAVLVGHSTPVLAAARLDDPEAARDVMLAELRGVLEVDAEPRHVEMVPWPLAAPVTAEVEQYLLTPSMLGLCGDGWHGPSRIESAYLSGRALGQELAALLSSP